MTEPYDSTTETLAHIRRVQTLAAGVSFTLMQDVIDHDASKLCEPEKSMFDTFIPLLSGVVYGSDEYWAFLTEMKQTGLRHHYQNNDHHPEHYPNGVIDMSLPKILHMLIDWKATNERDGGNFAASLRINRIRFNIPDAVFAIMWNTARELGWVDESQAMGEA